MKKKFFIILALVLFSILFFINLDFLSANDIVSIELSAKGSKAFVEKSEYENFIKLIKDSNTIESDVATEGNPYFYMKFTLKDKEKKYKVFFNLDKKTLYYKKNKKIYLLNKKSSHYFYLYDFFDYIYYPKTEKIDLYFKSNLINYQNLDKKLTYKKIDNKHYTKSMSTNSNKSHINTISKESNLIIKSEYDNFKLIIKNEEDNIIHENFITNKNDIYIPNKDGLYTYEFIYESTSNNLLINKIYKIKVDNPLEVSLNNRTVKQGSFITLKVFNKNPNESLTIKNPFYNKFNLYDDENYKIGYIPINSKVTPGEYYITYKINENKAIKLKINVIERNFRIQNLYVTKKIMDSSSNYKAFEEYNKYYDKSHVTSTYDDPINENFIWPINGKVTTEYGERRFINDVKTSYSHSGVDIAATRGTKVKATNNGQVTLSMHLDLTGNTIVIDHGKGIFSFYLHLDKRYVDKGAYVNQNEIIGSVGSTGRSTGSHLHFAISFHDKYIDPGFLVFNEAITKSNYQELINKK